MSAHYWRSLLVVALVVALACFFTQPMPSALAEHGNDGDPISEVPELFPSGTVFGSIVNHEDATDPNGKTNEECQYVGLVMTNGASAYKFTAPLNSQIKLDVFDDLGGQSLCEVSLYRQHLGLDSLPALYGFPDREKYLAHDTNRCPIYNSVCRVEWPLPASDTYYLVFWPYSYQYGQGGTPNFARFRFTLSITESPGLPSPTEVKCQKLQATILGTNGNDNLIGSPVRDVILGLRGNDVIKGRKGHDRVCAGPGTDSAFGGLGNDRLLGEAGNDKLNGGRGADRLVGGRGSDVCIGGSGNDQAVGCEVTFGVP
jgi:hemolysin type calcium-binding protein